MRLTLISTSSSLQFWLFSSCRSRSSILPGLGWSCLASGGLAGCGSHLGLPGLKVNSAKIAAARDILIILVGVFIRRHPEYDPALLRGNPGGERELLMVAEKRLNSPSPPPLSPIG